MVKITKGGSKLVSDDGTSSCHITFYKKGMFLHSLITDKNAREKGNATSLLTTAKRIARKKKIPLELTACPFHDIPYNLNRLIKFYTKRGFSLVRADNYAALMKYEVLND